MIYGIKSRQAAQLLSCILSWYPFVMMERDRCRGEDQRTRETPFLLPFSFGATAKSILKSSQLKQLWKHRTVCTLRPTSGSERCYGHDCCSFTFPSEPQGELQCDTKVSHHSKCLWICSSVCVHMCWLN